MGAPNRENRRHWNGESEPAGNTPEEVAAMAAHASNRQSAAPREPVMKAFREMADAVREKARKDVAMPGERRQESE